MKTDTLKKSLLDYAIKGKLTARFRRENSGLSAFDEISTYNEAIKAKRKSLEKELKKCEKEFKLEKDKDKKAFFKSQIQILKKEIAKCKEITPLNLSEAPFEIPNSWAWVKLGDICEIRLGKTPPRDTKIYWNSNDYQWVSIADMGESKILTQTKEHISQAGREKCFGDFIFKKGTLLLSFKLTIGKVAFLGFDGFHNEGIASVLPLLHAENDQIFKEFLFHFLPPLTQLCESTGAIKGETLNKQKLNNLLIPLPPLCEQQEIVKKLDLLVSLANDFAITKENLKRIEKRIEKSLLKLALEGSLSKLYRRSSPTLSAFDEISTYNEAIKEKRKELEKELKTLESTLKKVGKRDFSPTAQNDKQKTTQSKASLENDKNATCHTEPLGEVSKTTESQLVIFASVGKSFARASECEKSTKEIKQNLKSQIQSLKKEIVKCKEITPLFCHTEPLGEVSNNTESTTSIIAKRKGVYPLPAPLNPEKNKVAAFSFRQSRGEPRCSSSHTQAEAGHYCPPFSAFAHHEAGESEAPFTIPNSWAWVKLGDICEINPKNDISDNVEISFIPMALIADSCQNTFTYELKLWKEVKGGFTHLCDNSVAFAKISPCFENGKSFVVKNLKNGYGAGTTELIVLLPYSPLLKEYVFYCVNSAFFVNQALKTFKGTAGQQRLNMDFVENFTIPLPPLQEQEYITQTLDTLFTLKKGLRVE